MANRRLLSERTGETLGLHYAMRWPRQELETARPLRTSPLYDLLAGRGAVFGAKNGWERANYFVRADAGKPGGAARTVHPHTLDKPHWLADVVARAAGDARGGRALRPDLVRQAAAAGPRRARRAAASLRQRDGRRARAHGLHADAERARRLRERPDGDPARPSTASCSSPARPSRPATPTGSAGTSARDEYGDAHRRQRP